MIRSQAKTRCSIRILTVVLVALIQRSHVSEAFLPAKRAGLACLSAAAAMMPQLSYAEYVGTLPPGVFIDETTGRVIEPAPAFDDTKYVALYEQFGEYSDSFWKILAAFSFLFLLAVISREEKESRPGDPRKINFDDNYFSEGFDPQTTVQKRRDEYDKLF
mmetsp:Transcript_98144/g.174710  ORF Transcript_98144/g.174710 Transcript_98144/m.174710 type:complete len:161 (-) Transcript_98144:58-540(-)